MPLLDVTDVLSDPDFMDPTLIRRRLVEAVDSQGEATDTPTETTFSGVPVPTKSLAMERTADAQIAKGSITIFTTYDLTSGEGNNDADIVVYRNAEYTVTNVDDWPYGQGFYQATCELRQNNPPASPQ